MQSVIRRGIFCQHQHRPQRINSQQVLRREAKWALRYGGKGFFAGSVGGTGIVTVNGKPARRKILLLDQATYLFVRSTWSKHDGSYRIGNLDPTRQYMIMAVDNYDSHYRPVAWDKLTPALDT